MFTGSVTGGDSLERIVEQLARLKNPDLMPLALDIKQAIVEGNREGLLAGTDGDGRPMAPLSDETYKRGRGGLGPELVPRFDGSQLIDRFRVEIQPSGENGIRLKAGWPGVEQVRYFKTGTRNRDGSVRMPARNPAGIRPATREKINAIVKAFKRKLSAGNP